MKSVAINILGFIVACAIGLLWVKLATMGFVPKWLADFIFSTPVLCIIFMIALCVMIDAEKRKITNAFLWGIGTMALPMVVLPLYLRRRSQIP